MKNKLVFKNYNNYNKNFKNKNINIFFMVFSSNKFVEHLILKLNKSFFNSRIQTKYNKNYKNVSFYVSTNISNYLLLKKYISFELNREKFKFRFLYIKINNNKLSTNFFENNFLSLISKEDEIISNLVFINYINLVIYHSLYIKIFMYIYFLIFSVLNSVKFFIIKDLK